MEESCLEESSVEPEQDDDSIRVKIADLGNACWVVSVKRDNLYETFVLTSATSHHLTSYELPQHLHEETIFNHHITVMAQVTICWPGCKNFACTALPFREKTDFGSLR